MLRGAAQSYCVGGVARQVQCCKAGYVTRWFLRLTMAGTGDLPWQTLSLALQFLCLVLLIV
jgi:hypothetical protein